jgi:hypothetical protein
MLLRESVFERSGFPVRVKKTHLTKNEGFGVTRRTPRHFSDSITGVIPGRSAGPNPESRDSGFDAGASPRNDAELPYSATTFASSAISASGAVTFGEWLASISK